MTIATDKGFKIGSYYTTCFKEGSNFTVRFKRDDGTQLPAFNCPRHFDRDGWAYFNLDVVDNKEVDKYGNLLVKEEEEEAKDVNSVFSINVGSTTTITVSRSLTGDEIGRLSEILGGK